MTHGKCAGSLSGSGIRRSPRFLFESDRPLSDTSTTFLTSGAWGTFDEEGNYTPRQVVADDLGMSFAEAIAGTMVDVEESQMVNGTVVKVDKDEVLLDIGYKSEGVIPARELSIRNDVDPSEIVKVGDSVEALVLTKEDKEGRLVPVSYTHLRAHETVLDLVCRLLLEQKKNEQIK